MCVEFLRRDLTVFCDDECSTHGLLDHRPNGQVHARLWRFERTNALTHAYTCPFPASRAGHRSRFSKTFAQALTYVTLTLTLPNALFTFLAFPKEVRARSECTCKAIRRAHLPVFGPCRRVGARSVLRPLHARLIESASPYLELLDMCTLPRQTAPHVCAPCCSIIISPNRQAAAHGNAFAIFPKSPAKSLGIVLMVAHQLVAFGLFILPVCVMWEKLVGTHYKATPWKLASRMPVGGCAWGWGEGSAVHARAIKGAHCRCDVGDSPTCKYAKLGPR